MKIFSFFQVLWWGGEWDREPLQLRRLQPNLVSFKGLQISLRKGKITSESRKLRSLLLVCSVHIWFVLYRRLGTTLVDRWLRACVLGNRLKT